jgi:hypothetical protein
VTRNLQIDNDLFTIERNNPQIVKNEKETKYANFLCTGGCFGASFEFLEYLIGYTSSKCNTNPIQD